MAKRKKYVSYAQLKAALGQDPREYILTCKREAGVSDRQLIHDIQADSGLTISYGSVRLWRTGGGGAAK